MPTRFEPELQVKECRVNVTATIVSSWIVIKEIRSMSSNGTILNTVADEPGGHSPRIVFMNIMDACVG